VVHPYDPSYSVGRVQEECGWRSAHGKINVIPSQPTNCTLVVCPVISAKVEDINRITVQIGQDKNIRPHLKNK
jgi:hypothetical protein